MGGHGAVAAECMGCVDSAVNTGLKRKNKHGNEGRFEHQGLVIK